MNPTTTSTSAPKRIRSSGRMARKVLLDAGLTVIGSRGLGGVRRALIGSVSDSVVRHAHCPVLVVREG